MDSPQLLKAVKGLHVLGAALEGGGFVTTHGNCAFYRLARKVVVETFSGHEWPWEFTLVQRCATLTALRNLLKSDTEASKLFVQRMSKWETLLSGQVKSRAITLTELPGQVETSDAAKPPDAIIVEGVILGVAPLAFQAIAQKLGFGAIAGPVGYVAIYSVALFAAIARRRWRSASVGGSRNSIVWASVGLGGAAFTSVIQPKSLPQSREEDGPPASPSVIQTQSRRVSQTTAPVNVSAELRVLGAEMFHGVKVHNSYSDLQFRVDRITPGFSVSSAFVEVSSYDPKVTRTGSSSVKVEPYSGAKKTYPATKQPDGTYLVQAPKGGWPITKISVGAEVRNDALQPAMFYAQVQPIEKLGSDTFNELSSASLQGVAEVHDGQLWMLATKEGYLEIDGKVRENRPHAVWISLARNRTSSGKLHLVHPWGFKLSLTQTKDCLSVNVFDRSNRQLLFPNAAPARCAVPWDQSNFAGFWLCLDKDQIYIRTKLDGKEYLVLPMGKVFSRKPGDITIGCREEQVPIVDIGITTFVKPGD